MKLSVELVLGFLGTIGSLIVLAREALKLARSSREGTGQHITVISAPDNLAIRLL